MATCKLLNFVTILSLFLVILHSQIATSFDIEEQEDDDDSEYVLDAPFATTRLRARFLARIKKGTHCNVKTHNVCNGVSANKGTSLLYCCKTHCRNVLGDRNNCGRCEHKCSMNERCCNGHCLDVFNDTQNCGKCNRKCSTDLRCEYGYCGYA